MWVSWPSCGFQGAGKLKGSHSSQLRSPISHFPRESRAWEVSGHLLFFECARPSCAVGRVRLLHLGRTSRSGLREDRFSDALDVNTISPRNRPGGTDAASGVGRDEHFATKDDIRTMHGKHGLDRRFKEHETRISRHTEYTEENRNQQDTNARRRCCGSSRKEHFKKDSESTSHGQNKERHQLRHQCTFHLGSSGSGCAVLSSVSISNKLQAQGGTKIRAVWM